jgi:uncharacterized Rmd1/YagE family protein
VTRSDRESHSFHAVAFAENLPLKELAPHFPGAVRTAHELRWACDTGAVFLFPFGALVFLDVPEEQRRPELDRLRAAVPALSSAMKSEEIVVRVDSSAAFGIENGALQLDRLTAARAGIIALTVAQSASMEYYEAIVEEMFARTGALVARLEQSGTVPVRVRPLHRFIGEALSTRSEVLSVLHLLDKPEAAWDDPAMDAIYDDLRDEFDLVDRFSALEHKLKGMQESLELVLDVARDRRLVFLEASIVILIVFEIVIGFVRGH